MAVSRKVELFILAECSMMLGAVKDVLAEKNGEECAMEEKKNGNRTEIS